ncbi:hypothetical protein CHLRE_11g468200v5 [Chlamydomonas reinhardtii]|uniref:Uncharacterized protein n=1 Tax=Chlamydomonas reinhardtii TaxID=3055 RepID=A0A2K3D842_CHLRE|nr:uncharacterized protein CHLRE_11g468200v5 [Chlamydomonas reinhardtii]PNW76700.1 hypothetical protein CHLRE_11g468200v5 [Chlamydomonas reinhardtii]
MDRPLSIPLLLLAARAAGWAAMAAAKRADARARFMCKSAMNTSTRRLPQSHGRRLPLLPAHRAGPAVVAGPASRSGAGLGSATASASVAAGSGAGMGAFGAGGSCSGSGGAGARDFTQWASSVKSRIFPAAVRLAIPMTAACMAAAAGTNGQYFQAGAAPGGGAAASPTAVTKAATATHGAAAAAAMAAPPPLPVLADVRACRLVLEQRGISHPGLQPGAAWAALPVGTGPDGKSGDLHVMFEYLLLFPA